MKLELRGITKRFGSLVANDHIDLTVEAGEIHCLLGENGAGKSTLMNVLYGLYQADEGEVLLDDEVQHFAGPGDAMAAGIGMVHQHFMLIPVFTVAENVMLGHESTRAGGLLDLPAARAKVREISERFGFDVDPDALVDDLPVGVQQRVEIIKALSRDARVLVFDEPTAVLTPQETDELMGIMRQLKADGHLDRVHHPQAPRGARGRRPHHGDPPRQGRRRGVADGVERRARVAHGRPRRRADGAARRSRRSATMRSSVEGLTVIDPIGQLVVNDVSFTVRRGEILAVAGVQGNGQTELTEALLGLQPRVQGSHQPRRRSSSPRRASGKILDAGVGFVPEDRTEDGLVGEFTIAENLMLDRVRRCAVRARPATSSAAFLAEFAREKVKEFDVRTQGIDDEGRPALGRQPAEGRARARAQPRPAPARRRAADPRRRRRLDRVHPQAHRRDARRRRPGRRRLDRARRGRRARRPHHGHVPRAASSASCPATPRVTCSA